MTASRTYSMESRAVAAEATRQRILEAAEELFLADWYEDVTIARVAAGAGVSGQTVLNHFGGKEQLFAAAIEQMAQGVVDVRYSATPGDVGSIVDVLIDDYERTGDAVVRLLAVEDRLPAARAPLAAGRRGHREWLEAMFGAATPELLAATDVYVWKLLRRDHGLGRDATAAAMRRMVESLPAPTTP